MIRPLRQRHRQAVCALGVLLPMALAAAVFGRRPVPVARAIPPSLQSIQLPAGAAIWTPADLWPGQRIATRLLRDASGKTAIELTAQDLVRPDVLVYWTTAPDPKIEHLPDDARLLGVFSSGTALSAAAESRSETGRLVLYSLADHEVVAVSSPFNLEKP